MEEGLTLVNFGHPLTVAQKTAIERMTRRQVEEVCEIGVQFDNSRSFTEQVDELIEAVEFSPKKWAGRNVLVALPGHSVIAALLVKRLYELTGVFPRIIRFRPAESSFGGYDVAEII